MNQSKLRVIGVCFDHMHMGDLLAKAKASSSYEIVGVYDTDAERMGQVCADLQIPPAIQYTDWEKLIEISKPDVAMVCSTTAEHALWVERLASRGIHVLLEKPFAVSTIEATKAIDAAAEGGVRLAINWPLAWYPSHRTTQRIISEGSIGEVVEVHYYDGNRGPQYHLHAKKEVENPVDVSETWWFKESAGGGSLLDYLGYGVTLATWFREGELPLDVTAVSHIPSGYEVDLQSIVIARYSSGLSTFQTRWGTFTDPWTVQPQPFCGFVVVGTKGTIMSRDYADVITLQTSEKPELHDIPVDIFDSNDNILGLLRDAIKGDSEVPGPCGSSISLGAQKIVDAAVLSAKQKAPVAIVKSEARI